jgi:hypothetical protein
MFQGQVRKVEGTCVLSLLMKMIAKSVVDRPHRREDDIKINAKEIGC